MKHTPGPWTLGERNGQEIQIDANNGDPTLRMVEWTGLAVVYGCDDDPANGRMVMEKNARLIAAAPDLLRALEKIAAWSSHTDDFSINYGSNGERDLYRSIARAAIDKATGEA